MYAIWHGGTNYSRIASEDNVETFDSLAQAVSAFQDRYRLGQHFPQKFRYVRKPEQHVLTPNVDNTSELRLFDDDPALADDPKPDVVLTFGPRDRILRTYPSTVRR